MLTGAFELSKGVWIRGRGLRHPEPPGPSPDFALYLGRGKLRTYRPTWTHDWVDWPDFLVPKDFDTAVAQIKDLHRRARDGQHVETACGGGIGRTGTVVSCLAVLEGVPAHEAVAWTRQRLHPKAVEMPWQHRWITRFAERA